MKEHIRTVENQKSTDSDSVNGRIGLLVKKYEMGYSKFEGLVNVSRGVIYNIAALNGKKSKPNYDTLVKIVENSVVSPDWLLMGRGDM